MKKKTKITIVIIVILGLVLIGCSFLYTYYLSPVDKKSNAVIEVEVEPGMTSRDIGELLEKRGVIKNKNFFLVYLKLNDCNSLKASTYDLKKSMNLEEVVSTLCKGNSYNANVIRVTFKEGKTVKDYMKVISDNFGYDYDTLIKDINDRAYLQTLIEKYWFLESDILDENIYYPLEGYLTPDTYEFDKNTEFKKIIEVLLDHTDKNLSPYKKQITTSKFSVHEYLTLASMTELEGLNSKDRKLIVGVFINRLNLKMSLGSDVTTYYGLQKNMDRDLTTEEFNKKNYYNTRASSMAGKLPIGPICNPSKVSIDASINPTDSEYLYFVADKNGKIYYNTTNQDHLKTVKEIKEAGNWIW
jgi:UPF0755 protein